MDIPSYLLGKKAGGGGDVNLQNKSVTITSNGNSTVRPDSGYDGLSSVGITTDVVPSLQNKQVSVTQNGTSSVSADSNYDGLGTVEINTNVAPNLQSKEVTITENTTTNITPDTGYDGLSGVSVITNVSGGADLSEYFVTEITQNSNNAPLKVVKKTPPIFIANNVSSLRYGFKNANINEIQKITCNSNVTEISDMFRSCTASKIDISGMNISNVEYLSYLFLGCINLTNIEFGNIDTTNIKYMNNMFDSCQNLVELDLSAFYTPNLLNTQSMFLYCKKLTKIDIRNMTFDLVTTYANMFGSSSSSGVPDNCEIIVKDDVTKTWVTSNFSRLTNVKTVAEYEAE